VKVSWSFLQLQLRLDAQNDVKVWIQTSTPKTSSSTHVSVQFAPHFILTDGVCAKVKLDQCANNASAAIDGVAIVVRQHAKAVEFSCGFTQKALSKKVKQVCMQM